MDFSANNNNVTLSASSGFNGSGSGARTINLGNGLWTISASTGTFNLSTATNLTFSANSSTISFTGTGNRTLQPGAQTFSTVSAGAGVVSSAASSFQITGAGTIATLTVAAPNRLLFPASATVTITNAYSFVGTPAAPIGLISNGPPSAATISIGSGTATLAWGAIGDMTFTGGATFTATNALDLGHNSNVTITPPSWLVNPHMSGGMA